MLSPEARTISNSFNLPLVILGMITAFLIHFIPLVHIKEGYYTLMVFAMIFLLIQYANYNRQHEALVKSVILGILVFLIIHFLYHLGITYGVIQEWDFMCFYLFGKVGISNHDYYNPEVFAQSLKALDLQSSVSSNFVKEIVEVGFWYPPPSMFLFLPLGLFDLQTGYILWQTFFISFLLIDIYLLIKFYSTQTDKAWVNTSHVLPVMLILLFPNLTTPISLGQTASLFLFLLIWLIYYVDNWKAGIFLPVLVVIKPLAAVFFLYFLFFRKWKALIASAVTGAIILGLTLLVFGLDPLLSYFKSPPTARIPDFVYSEYYSLFGSLKRLQASIPEYLSAGAMKMIYYAAVLVLICITLIASRKLWRISSTFAFMIFIQLAMLIYPATLNHYSIMTLPVFLYIFNQTPIKEHRLSLGFIFLLFGICYYSFFIYNFILWLILATWPLVLRLMQKDFSLIRGRFIRPAP